MVHKVRRLFLKVNKVYSDQGQISLHYCLHGLVTLSYSNCYIYRYGQTVGRIYYVLLTTLHTNRLYMVEMVSECVLPLRLVIMVMVGTSGLSENTSWWFDRASLTTS